jgi:hypothetical protein
MNIVVRMVQDSLLDVNANVTVNAAECEGRVSW